MKNKKYQILCEELSGQLDLMLVGQMYDQHKALYIAISSIFPNTISLLPFRSVILYVIQVNFVFYRRGHL